MPNKGQVNNSGGVNGYSGPGGAETPYGAVKRLGQMTKAAPIGPVPGVTAPKQASRAAQRGTQTEAPLPSPEQTVMGVEQLPYPVVLAQTWAQLAADPDASPLVRQIAQEAQNGI